MVSAGKSLNAVKRLHPKANIMLIIAKPQSAIVCQPSLQILLKGERRGVPNKCKDALPLQLCYSAYNTWMPRVVTAITVKTNARTAAALTRSVQSSKTGRWCSDGAVRQLVSEQGAQQTNELNLLTDFGHEAG